MNHNLDSAILNDYVHGSATTIKNGFRLAVGIVDTGAIVLPEQGLSDKEVEAVLEGDSGSGVADLWQIKALTSTLVQGKRK